MGRHGGGSRGGGGGGGGSRSGGGSRGGGRSSRTSSTPFNGCYNRSYYDRRGRFHTCYTSNRHFGTRSGWNPGIIFAFVFITMHMLIMVGSFIPMFIEFGSKINGDKDRIFIEDRMDILSDSDERDIIELFEEVYDKSGMPVTLYTDDFSWKSHYQSLEVYSEELYYNISYDEDAMLILFTVDNSGDFYDWEYDMYCGDDTTKCFSDPEFTDLLNNFQKGMAQQDLSKALHHGWDSVMDNIGRTNFYWTGIPVVFILLAVYGLFYSVLLVGVRKQNAAYKYFKEHPEELSMERMVLYSTCPNCGASNANQESVCRYCGGLLKVREGNITYVRPDDM